VIDRSELAAIVATLVAVGPLLTSRRTVDLCRLGSCLCPVS